MWMETQDENRDTNNDQNLKETTNAEQKNLQIQDDLLLTSEKKVEDLANREYLEGPALLDHSFKSSRTERIQEGGANILSNDLEKVTAKPESLLNSMSKVNGERFSTQTDGTDLEETRGAILLDEEETKTVEPCLEDNAVHAVAKQSVDKGPSLHEIKELFKL